MSMTITPLHLGSIIRDKSAFTLLKNAGEKVELPIIAYLVETGEVKILVDTGTNAPEDTAEYHKPLMRKKEQELPYLLSSFGVVPEDISIVIFTHLHWDHCHNNYLFPKARFVVQKSELDYSFAPVPAHSHGYDMPPIINTRFDVINGDVQIARGVVALLTPGHSPGSQCVLLSGSEKKVLLAGDTIPLYESWAEKSRPVPSGVYVNLEDYYFSFEKLGRLGFDLFLPGHELKVFENHRYII